MSPKSELQLIDWVRTQQRHGKRTRIGIGDDCAAIDFRPGETCLVTTDALVDGVHFDLSTTDPELVGQKAVNVSLSDVAAMAGLPIAIVIAAAIPSGAEDDLPERLCHGFKEACELFAVDLVGGDVVATPGPLTITTTVLGAAPAQRVCERSDAQVRDAILVTGSLGGSILGKHLTFTPRLNEAQKLVRNSKIHAMIDISDGLSQDLKHILDESGRLGAVLEAEAIPCSDAAHERSRDTGKPALWHALNDGEDFELLLTASQHEAKRLLENWEATTPITEIGIVTGDHGIQMQDASGQLSPVVIEGYEHLRP